MARHCCHGFPSILAALVLFACVHIAADKHVRAVQDLHRSRTNASAGRGERLILARPERLRGGSEKSKVGADCQCAHTCNCVEQESGHSPASQIGQADSICAEDAANFDRWLTGWQERGGSSVGKRKRESKTEEMSGAYGRKSRRASLEAMAAAAAGSGRDVANGMKGEGTCGTETEVGSEDELEAKIREAGKYAHSLELNLKPHTFCPTL